MARSILKDIYILILGGSYDQLFMINTAKKMKLGTIVLDGKPNAPGFKIADFSKNIDFSDLPKVFEFIDSLKKKKINICGVSTMGSDVPHILAKISKH